MSAIHHKRLRKELKKFKINDDYWLDYESNNIKLYIKQLKFIITCNYPFKPPLVYINEEDYIYKLRHANKILKTRHCLCCNSILCQNKWSPIFNICDIINEYNDIYEQIKNRLYVKILKFRNLRDWNLEDVYEIILDFL